MTPKYSDLQNLSDETLVQLYDGHAANTVVGTRFYLDEISRRKLAKDSERMMKLTETMSRLTWVILIFTLVNVALVSMQVWLAFSSGS